MIGTAGAEPSSRQLVSLVGAMTGGRAGARAMTRGSEDVSEVRYRALAASLEAAITTNQIPAGARLPAQRELAQLLGVGRTTVVAAYNLLRAKALIRSTRVTGTWVVGRRVQQPERETSP